MKLSFREVPWDLRLCLGYALATTTSLTALGIGSILAIPLVLVTPGYVVMSVLFPSNGRINWIERVALSLAMSVTVSALMAFLLDLSSWGISGTSVIAVNGSFTVVVGIIAYAVRTRLPPANRLSASVQIRKETFLEEPRLDRFLTILLVASIATAASTMAYFALSPRPGAPYTEFFILGSAGNASGHPMALNVSEAEIVVLGIANHESVSVNYMIHIDLVGVRLAYNATLGYNETVEVNRTIWSTLNVSLTNEASWTYNYTFSISFVGLWKVQFLLFKGGDTASVYRELHLFIRVT